MGGMVTVFAPDGSKGEIPYERLAEAVKAGAKPSVTFKAPDGSLGDIPADRIQDAVKAGGTLMPLEEQENKHPGFWKSLGSDVAGLMKGAVTAGAAAFGNAQAQQQLEQGIAEQIVSAPEDWKRRKEAGYPTPYRIAAPVASAIGVNVPGMEQSAKEGDVAGVAGHAAAVPTVMAATAGLGKAVGAGLSKVGELRARLAPKEVPIGTEKVPVLVGEANPTDFKGRVQIELKRSGAGEQSFNDFSTAQQGKVKQVIRNVAQQTSGMVGPMGEEPAAAMGSAADATFAKAKPMYEAMDESLTTVPDAMGNVSKVTDQAIARASKLGVNVEKGAGESVVINGKKITPATDPAGWANLQEQGLVPKTSGQPLQTYMKVRSELLKMQRSATDAATRYAIGNEIEAMTGNMETALKGTPLWDTWNEASRLWSKGYAIRDVADALRSSTEGTPAAEQAPGLSQIPTTIKGGQLVARLNDLQENGILNRAFTPEEVKNLRQSADILDRGSSTAGREFGFGYSWHSTLWRNIIKWPAYPIVKAMTTPAGVQALGAGDVSTFMGVVAASSGNKTPGELKQKAASLAVQ